jgi:HK97 family phage major capsid protein
MQSPLQSLQAALDRVPLDLADLADKSGDVRSCMEIISETAEFEKRDLTAEEHSAFKRGADFLSRSKSQVEHAARSQGCVSGPQRCDGPDDDRDFNSQGRNSMNSAITPQATWHDKHGQQICILGKGQRLADLPENRGVLAACPNGFGHFLAGLIDPGRRKNAPAEVRAAMFEASPGAGGVLVPSQLSAQIIDAARAASVCFRAGAKILPMASATMDLARVTTDPTFSVHGENETITESDVVFDAISLVSRTIATRIIFSRELAEDASNLVELIGDVCTRALAAELDRQFLVGAAGDEMQGVVTNPNIGSTGSVGAIAWADLLTALSGIEAANFTPNAYMVHPSVSNDLNALTSGDGANSAALWQGPPPGVDRLERLVSSNVTTANIVMGDFSKLLVGLRQDALVEVSAFGDGFDTHSVHLKVTWRGDCALAQPLAFYWLGGITT